MILLDTHVLAWLTVEPQRLSRPAASAIRRARASDGLAIASISVWELAVLFTRGLLRSHGTVEASVTNVISRAGIVVLPITPEIAALASQLPPDYPKDPADRLIGATALASGIALVTRDERIQTYGRIKTIW